MALLVLRFNIILEGTRIWYWQVLNNFSKVVGATFAYCVLDKLYNSFIQNSVFNIIYYTAWNAIYQW